MQCLCLFFIYKLLLFIYIYILLYIYNVAFEDSTCVQTKEKKESTSVKTTENYDETTTMMYDETSGTTLSIDDDSKHVVDKRTETLRYYTHKHVKYTIIKQFYVKLFVFY